MATLDTVANRSTGSQIAGKAYFETDTNKLIVWNGTAWIELHSDGEGAVPPAYLIYTIAAIGGDFTLALDTGDYTVDWGDGSLEETVTASTTHTYEAAGDYQLKISVNSGTYDPGSIAGNTASSDQITGLTMESGFPLGADQSLMAYLFRNLTSVTIPAGAFAGVTNGNSMFRDCRYLTSLEGIDFPDLVDCGNLLYGMGDLITPPSISSSNVTSIENMCFRNYDLTSAPAMPNGAPTKMDKAFQECRSITAGPDYDLSAVTSAINAFRDCRSVLSFPAYNLASATNVSYMFNQCSAYTSVPNHTFGPNCTNFSATWVTNSSITSFPVLDVSMGTKFPNCWANCSSLTSFPALNMSASTSFSGTWVNCTSLSDFPANVFDNNTSVTTYANAFKNCALTAQSIENILVSWDNSGVSNLSAGLDSGTNAGQSTWSAAANTALTNLQNKGWTIAYNA